jgi:ubiquinol-cytochrome c reductase subunit 6
MGFFDYVSDLYSSVSFQPVDAEEPDARQFQGPVDTSGTQNSGKDARSGGVGTAEHDRGATTFGGASLSSPAAGTDEESSEEAEVNKEDAAKAASKQGESAKGHTPGEGGEASGQVGADNAGPHGGPVGASDDDEEEDDEEEEEEEEEEEPEDIKPRLEEGESELRAHCCGKPALRLARTCVARETNCGVEALMMSGTVE